MYRKDAKTSEYEVQNIICNLPPVGYIYNPRKEAYEYRGVFKRSLKKKDQFWERTKQPDDYRLKLKDETRVKRTNPKYVDTELQTYRIQEWDRRLHGFWFMNNGVPTYITGLHYFYLCHWRLDTGYPDFRIPDMEFFYFLEYCIQDPRSKGMIECTKRRQGKTVRAGVFLYEYTSRTRNANGGIQSKKLDDAKKNVFGKGIVMPFKQLEDFFKPVYDTDKGVTPKNELRFFKPNKRGKVQDEYDPRKELESEITFQSSDEFAYDGQKLQRYVADEVGKTKEVDVYKRHQVVQFCLELDAEIIGKALYTTTVEEMDDGGEHFKELWDASDQTERQANDRTKSGLYRYFLPAYRTLYYDKYGQPDEERAKTYYLNEREALQDDPKALASYIRKNPFTIEEAFWSDGDSCMYNAIKINNQLEAVSWQPEKDIMIRGKFIWKNGERDSSVVFVEDKKGHFLINKKVDIESGWNAIASAGSRKRPMNTSRLVAGIDPYDHNTTVDNRRSDGAGYVFWKFDATSELSESFVCEYIHRPSTSDVFYEDMIKMCHFFGCKALIEDNKIGMIKYFQSRGYSSFLLKLKGSKKVGISATSKTHQQLAEVTEAYIEESVENTVYKRLLKDWLKFDLKNTTKFDAAMAAGWALVGAGRRLVGDQSEKKKKVYNYRQIFRN